MRIKSLILLICNFILILNTSGQVADHNLLLKIIESWHKDAGGDLTGDGRTDNKDLFQLIQQWSPGNSLIPTPTPPSSFLLTRLAESSPYHEENGVAVTRETILYFNQPINRDLIDENAFQASFAGEYFSFRKHISKDNQSVTLFYDRPLPPSARIRVTIDGDKITDGNGLLLDADGDGREGGQVSIDFSTLSLTDFPNTAVCGRVFASELNPNPDGELSINKPLAGVLITVDGRENELFTVTDEQGNFRLEPAPAGRFFVHVDGLMAQVVVPEGAYYPFVGKTWQSVPGEEVNVGNVYLPLVQEGTLQPVSETQDTVITFSDRVLQEYPEIEGVNITVPANSLYSDDGTRGGMVGIAPVPPDRLPGQLPTGLEFPVVITVQTNGPTNFDVPIPACFPNLPDPATGEPLPPGTKNGLYSFNHDKGYWEYMGLMTVSADGMTICSDPGVGILAPGWHGSGPPPASPPPQPCPNPPCECQPSPAAFAKTSYIGNLSFPLDIDVIESCQIVCDNKRIIKKSNCDLQAIGILSACMLIATFSPPAGLSCLIVDAVNLIFCNLFAEQEHGMCIENCNSRDCIGGTSSKALVHHNIKPQQVDPVYDEISIVLQDIVGVGLSIDPNNVSENDAIIIIEEIQNQLDYINQIAGGSAEEYLKNHIMELEEEILEIEQQIGMDPGNAPSYPVLYAAEILRGTDTMYIRGETQGFGQYQLFVPRDGELQQIYFYDPKTKSYGLVHPWRHPESLYQLPALTLVPLDGTLHDTDLDGLADWIEIVYGTDIENPDSDGDGISDGAEVEQNTNPLDGLPVKTGIIASVDTPGTALDVYTLNDVAIVADSDRGVSVFNIFNGMEPTIIAQVDTPGNAIRVAGSGNLIAVADGPAGLAIIDISDPPDARIVHQIAIGGQVNTVASSGGIAIAGTESGIITMIDMTSGNSMSRMVLDEAVQDLGIQGEFLYVLTRDQLYKFSLFGDVESPFQSVASPFQSTPNSRLFIGDQIAYAVHGKGYNTFDLSQSESPVLISSGNTQQFGWKQIVENGSGIGIAAVSPNFSFDGPHNVSLYDVSDPSQTDVFLTQINTPGIARAVTIYNGLAYVVDHNNGLQVINYLPYDNQGISPNLNLSANFSLNPPELEEGKTAIVTARVSDDVQVRNVEFYIDGEKILTDGNFPFEFSFIAPRISDQPMVSLRIRASDTGGNFVDEDFTIQLTNDSTPPVIRFVSPVDNSFIGRTNLIAVFFDEVIDEVSLNANNITIIEAGLDGLLDTGDDVLIQNNQIEFRTDILGAFLQLPDLLAAGLYRVSVGNALQDLAGNKMASDYQWVFRIYDFEGDDDNDCLINEVELALGLNPNDPDSDGNGILDGNEDSDGDGLINCEEIFLDLDPRTSDTDIDIFNDQEELSLGTDPTNADSDQDGFVDGEEIELGSDPLDPESVPQELLEPLSILVHESFGFPFTVYNENPPPVYKVNEASHLPFTIYNDDPFPIAELRETANLPFSVFNENHPPVAEVHEATTLPFSVLNEFLPIGGNISEIFGHDFSVDN